MSFILFSGVALLLFVIHCRSNILSRARVVNGFLADYENFYINEWG